MKGDTNDSNLAETHQRYKEEMKLKKERLAVFLVFLVLIAGGTYLSAFGDEPLQENQSLMRFGEIKAQLEGIDKRLANIEIKLDNLEIISARVDLGFSNHLSEHAKRSDRWFEILIVVLMAIGLLMIKFVPRPEGKKEKTPP